MVSSELELEAVGGELAVGERHYPGIVDEQIEVATLPDEGYGEIADGREAGEVQLGYFEVCRWNFRQDAMLRVVRLLRDPAGENDVSAGSRELLGGVEADAAVGSGHESELAALRGNVGCGPVLHGVLDAAGGARSQFLAGRRITRLILPGDLTGDLACGPHLCGLIVGFAERDAGGHFAASAVEGHGDGVSDLMSVHDVGDVLRVGDLLAV